MTEQAVEGEGAETEAGAQQEPRILRARGAQTAAQGARAALIAPAELQEADEGQRGGDLDALTCVQDAAGWPRAVRRAAEGQLHRLDERLPKDAEQHTPQDVSERFTPSLFGNKRKGL